MIKRSLCTAVALLLAVLMLFSGCASHGKTLIKAGGEEISVNVFQLYLSRMKGSLAHAGYKVTDDSYWNSYISTDNTTTADYYTAQVFEGLRHIAAAMIMYDEYELELSDEAQEEIDAWIESLIEDDGEGSKATLNSILAQYGANITALRDAAIIEAKLAQLKEYLYGAGGALIGDTAIEEYYKATYFRGYQMQLANYYYEHEKDPDGIAVRYTDDTYKTVAYATITDLSDEEKAKYREVENTGEVLEKYGSKYGSKILFYRDGDTEIVAYAQNGVINYILDANQEKQKKEYTEAEMQARYDRALEIAATCAGDEELFLQCISDFSDNSDFNATYAPNGMYFSVGEYATDTIFGTFAAELAKMEVEGTKVLSTDSGYYVIMRAKLDTGAWQNDANSRWFENLVGMTLEYMLQQRTTTYLDRVTFDEALLATVNITMVGSNMRY